MKKVNVNVNSKLSNDFVEDLKKEPFLKNYNITSKNANMLYVMNEERRNCEHCLGLKNCQNNSIGFYTVVEVSGENYVQKAKMCRYKEQLVAQNNKNSLIKTMYIPKGILESKIDDFHLTSENRKKAFSYALKFINEYKKDHFLEGMLLTGSYQTGKTYLLGAIANELSKKGIECLLIYFPDLIRELKNAIGSSRFDEIINMLKTIPVLMIDDLGSEMLTSWLRDEVVGPILNYRVSEKLPLFISSNLDYEKLVEHFASPKDDQKDFTKSARIMTRICSLVVVCDLGNKTYRK